MVHATAILVLVMHTAFVLERFASVPSNEFGDEMGCLIGQMGCEIHSLRWESDLGSRLLDNIYDAEQQALLGLKEGAKVIGDHIGENVQIKRESTQPEKTDTH